MKNSIYIMLIAGCCLLLYGCHTFEFPDDFQVNMINDYFPYLEGQKLCYANDADTVQYKCLSVMPFLHRCKKGYQCASEEVRIDVILRNENTQDTLLMYAYSYERRLFEIVVDRKPAGENPYPLLSYQEKVKPRNIYSAMPDSILFYNNRGLIVRNEGLLSYTLDDKKWELVSGK